jgi:hypothetical protein
MFRCQLCSCVALPHTRPHRLIIERRAKRYPFRPKANSVVRDRKRHHTDDPGGDGEEIAREALACPGCAKRHAVPGAATPSPPPPCMARGT